MSMLRVSMKPKMNCDFDFWGCMKPKMNYDSDFLVCMKPKMNCDLRFRGCMKPKMNCDFDFRGCMKPKMNYDFASYGLREAKMNCDFASYSPREGKMNFDLGFIQSSRRQNEFWFGLHRVMEVGKRNVDRPSLRRSEPKADLRLAFPFIGWYPIGVSASYRLRMTVGLHLIYRRAHTYDN